MAPNIKRVLPVILMSLCTMFLSCCTCFDMCDTITYEVTGMPRHDIVVEFLDGLGTIDSYPAVELPWAITFDVVHRGDEYQDGKHPGGVFNAYISATSAAHLVDLTVSIYVGKKLVQSGYSTESRRAAVARYKVNL